MLDPLPDSVHYQYNDNHKDVMNIGIDISALMYARGVSRYTSNLVSALAKKPNVALSLYGSSWRQHQQLTALATQALGSSHHRHHVTIQHYPPVLQDWLWNKLKLNSISSIMPNIDLFHSWDWLQPPDQELPLVSTIHDLALLRFPETAHPRIKQMHEQSWRRLKEKKAHIIAVSKATKRDIVELLGIPGHLVHVVYEALPMEFKRVGDSLSEEEAELLKTRLKLDRPFVLFVGTREPRKNILRLIEAWKPLAKELDLIIAGEAGWDETSSLQSQLPQLRFLGKVSDKALSVLYGEANVFAYPCLYEGFGLPILEAFSHGTPVVTSNVSSMPEVAGNAAELVNPLEVESIRQGLQTILNENIAQQKTRLQKMIIRQQLFSWSEVADETLSVYRQALEEKTS